MKTKGKGCIIGTMKVKDTGCFNRKTKMRTKDYHWVNEGCINESMKMKVKGVLMRQ